MRRRLHGAGSVQTLDFGLPEIAGRPDSITRHLFGFSGDSLTSGAVSGGANRGSSEAIATYLKDADSQLDIDGDGEAKPLTDGLLLIRYLFGFSGESLISGAIGTEATRKTAQEVEAYIQDRVPAQ